MKITLNQIYAGKLIPESSLYLIHGEPFHLINEIYSSIKRNLSSDIKNTIYYIESDSSIDDLRNDIESTSLFSEKIMITINILSTSIPRNLASYLQDIDIHEDIVIIIKINTTNASFKKSKIYTHLEKNYTSIEVRNLKGKYLDSWITKKLNINKVKCNQKSIELLKELYDGNTSALSQEIYKMSLDTSMDVETHLKFNYKYLKYSEFDLIEAILNQDRSKGMDIITSLRDSNFSEVYLLHLIQSEIRKFLYIKENIEPLPYIPSFKKNQYNERANSMSTDIFENLLSRCFHIDKYIKSSSNYNYVWDNFEMIFLELTNTEKLHCSSARFDDYGY